MTDTTRESVERWEVTHNANGLGFSDGIRQSSHGNFVALSDYAALLTRAEAAEAERDQIRIACKIERRAKEEARAERDALADKLKVAVEALQKLHHAVCGETGFAECVRRDSGKAYPWPALDIADTAARIALATLTADTPPDPRIEGWNAAIEAAARKVEVHNLGRNKDRADRMLASIRAIPCPYQPKEGKEDATDH